MENELIRSIFISITGDRSALVSLEPNFTVLWLIDFLEQYPFQNELAWILVGRCYVTLPTRFWRIVSLGSLALGLSLLATVIIGCVAPVSVRIKVSPIRGILLTLSIALEAIMESGHFVRIL